MLIEYKLGSLEAKLGAKIASVTSGHNVTCFDYEVMISPLFRWPNSLCHYNSIPVRLRLKKDFSDDEVEDLYKALDFLAEIYADEIVVPKVLGLALMDVYGMFSFRDGMYSKDKLIKLEDIGIELQEKAINIFS